MCLLLLQAGFNLASYTGSGLGPLEGQSDYGWTVVSVFNLDSPINFLADKIGLSLPLFMTLS